MRIKKITIGCVLLLALPLGCYSLSSTKRESPELNTENVFQDKKKKEKADPEEAAIESHKKKALKRAGASIKDLCKHVSVDTGCSVDSIEIVDFSEQLGNAVYVMNVCGERMKYRRTGTVFFKDGDQPYKAN